jgi:hypothetical protein
VKVAKLEQREKRGTAINASDAFTIERVRASKNAA